MSNLCKKLIHKLDAFLYWDFLCFRMQVKTQFSLSQNNCLVIENHLTVAPLWKAGIPDNDSPYYIEHTCTPAAQSADPSEPIPTVSTIYRSQKNLFITTLLQKTTEKYFWKVHGARAQMLCENPDLFFNLKILMFLIGQLSV